MSPSAIDVHVHPSTSEYLEGAMGHFRAATEAHFRTEIPVRTVAEMADEFRAADTLAVLLAWDAQTFSGLPPVTNDFVARCVADHPDAFVGFASVDPLAGPGCVDELRRAVEDLGLRGLKLHPSAQGFAPDDPQHDGLWETCIELGIPALVHTGTTGLGVGVPGGGGIALDLSRPMRLDTVAARHPELTIIAAHIGWPWTDELLAVLQHKPNVHIDLSGWSPRRWPDEFARQILGPLHHKALFGTDYPFITGEQWMRGFDTHEVDVEVRSRVLHDNAAALLGL